ncbi:unnamed protein product [Prorocentrum cordatum]|uniref:RNase NYN domain-containing protein n=1 Tax=Prorocentrum cordatum TaxID=2364126 RepID=A0ABN9VX58_9DINO|nr:unnamed protein product [Polarella glacialis]
MRGPPGAPRPPAPWRPVGVQNAPWRAPLAAGRPGSAGPTTDPARGGEHLSHVDSEGRPYNLNQIVVNFANVGAYFAKTVLKRDNRRGDRLFDWEGVRRCVKHLSDERSLKVVGVVYQNIDGPDNGVKVWDTPHDIKQMCQSIQQTPRLTGKNQRSADDEQTIKCAYRRNCRFMDNDNYREWLVEMRDEKCRNWLVEKQEMLQTRYFFDSELGTFDTLDGNIPMALLDRNNVNSMKMPIPAHLVGKC